MRPSDRPALRPQINPESKKVPIFFLSVGSVVKTGPVRSPVSDRSLTGLGLDRSRRRRPKFLKMQNFERQFTPQAWLRSASNFGETRFRRFPTFHFPVPSFFFRMCFSDLSGLKTTENLKTACF